MYSTIKKVLLLTLLAGCSKEVGVLQVETLPKSSSSVLSTSPFVAPKSSLLTMGYPKDSNGYYHIILDTLASMNRYNIYIEATKLKPQYAYNGVFNIQAKFKSSAAYRIYNEFLNVFLPVEVVPTSPIILKEYFGGSITQLADEYKPTDPSKMVWSKRIIGPVPDIFINDTIVIYCRIDWDASSYTLANPQETTKMDSLKIIFKKK
jgi:hypothetical protein